MDSKNLFCSADLKDIFTSLKKEPAFCIDHCPFCGVVCEVPSKNHQYAHKNHLHYFPGFFGTKLMIQSESEVEIRLIDNMTCTQIRSLMPEKKTDQKLMPDDQKTDQKKLAGFVLTQSNETKFITEFEKEVNWIFAESK